MSKSAGFVMDLEHISANSGHRIRRLTKANEKLQQCLISLAKAHKSIDLVCRDDAVWLLALKAGFERFDLVIYRIRAKERKFTVVCVPKRIWARPQLIEQLLDLKLEACAAGIDCILVPEGFLKRQPRLANSRIIGSMAEMIISASDRMAVLLHLVEEGGFSSVEGCASVVSNPDPVGVVFHLITTGAISVDMHADITPFSRVDLMHDSNSR